LQFHPDPRLARALGVDGQHFTHQFSRSAGVPSALGIIN
jgi:hypothetical protein